MSVIVEASAAIRDFFWTRFAQGVGLVIQHDNQAKPDLPRDGDTSWCRLIIQQGQTRQAMTGQSGFYRSTGQVLVQLFTPAGAGTATSRALVGLMQDAFRGQSIADPVVHFRTPSVVSETDESGRWMTVVSIPFTTQEHG